MKTHLLFLFLTVSVTVYSQPDEELVRKATNGSAKAQRELGWYYFIEGDSSNLVRWFTMAANQDDGQAIRHLGNYYHNRKDYKNAAIWWRRLVKRNKGDLWASAALGRYYREGKGVERSFEEALFWYEASIPKKQETISTTLGDVMIGLAVCYDSLGRYDDAMKWYQKCADVRWPYYASPAMYDFINRAGLIGLVRMYYLGLGVERNTQKVNQYINILVNTLKVTWFADIAYSQKEDEMHFFWMNIAARFSNVWVVELAKLYEKGKGVSQDYKKAYELYKVVIDAAGEVSAKGENLRSENNAVFYRSLGRLGIMYYYGYYVPQNGEEAFLRLKISSMMTNDSDIMLTLAYCYRDGVGTIQDMEQYKYWLSKAEEAGDQDAKQLREMAKEANLDKKGDTPL